jgi:hypothetical protein
MSLQSDILAKIRGKKVRMHSRAYFALLVAALGALFALSFLALAFIAAGIAHVVREYGLLHLFSFGWEGVKGFFASFPWELAALTILMLAGAYRLALRLRLSYRRPFAYTLLGIAAAAFALDALLMATPLYAAIFKSQGSPVARMMQSKRYMPDGFIPATIERVEGTTAFVRGADGQEREIEVGDAMGREELEPGSKVMLHTGKGNAAKHADRVKKIGKHKEAGPAMRKGGMKVK